MIYAIGDIHGQSTMLRALLEELERLSLSPEDTVVFLGDYVDRGENSRAVIEALLDFRERHANCVFLRGNHEQFMLNAAESDPPQLSADSRFILWSDPMLLWLQNGGADTLMGYRPELEALGDLSRWVEAIPEAHWAFIRNTQLEYITEAYHFVHAGILPPGKTWEEGEEAGLDPRLWIREPFLDSRADFNGRRVIFGHTPQMNGKPLVQRNKIGLDTGAVFGGPLTMAILEPPAPGRKPANPRFVQVEYARSE